MYVTHDQEEALSLADRLVVLREGRVQQIGTPEELYAQPANRTSPLHGLPQPARPDGHRRSGFLGHRRGRRPPADRREPRLARPKAAAKVAIRPEDFVVGDGRRTPSTSRSRSSSTTAASCRSRPGWRPGCRVYLRTDERLAPGDTVTDRRPGRAGPGVRAMTALDRRCDGRPAPRCGTGWPSAASTAPCCSWCPAVLVTACAVLLPVPLRPPAVVPAGARAGSFANYREFFGDPYLRNTIWTTLGSRCPARCQRRCLGADRLPDARPRSAASGLLHDDPGRADHARHGAHRRGPARVLRPGRLVQPDAAPSSASDRPAGAAHHNYWGVLLSLVITGFPFAFLLTLSYLSGIDPTLEKAAATLGAGWWQRFRYDHPAAAGARPGDHLLPDVRAGVLRVPLGACWSATRPARPASSRSRPTTPRSSTTTTRRAPPIAMIMARRRCWS